MVFDRRQNKNTGNLGENITTKYLEEKGYKIIGRNIVFQFGEIDILASFDDTIIIVEVKTVKGKGFGAAQDLVRFSKQNKLRMLAKAIEQKYPNRAIRIDVIAVDISCENIQIEHLQNAVEDKI